MSNVMSEFCKVRCYANGEDVYYVRKRWDLFWDQMVGARC